MAVVAVHCFYQQQTQSPNTCSPKFFVPLPMKPTQTGGWRQPDPRCCQTATWLQATLEGTGKATCALWELSWAHHRRCSGEGSQRLETCTSSSQMAGTESRNSPQELSNLTTCPSGPLTVRVRGKPWARPRPHPLWPSGLTLYCSSLGDSSSVSWDKKKSGHTWNVLLSHKK